MTSIARQSPAREFLRSLEAVVGGKPRGLHEPVFAGNEQKYVSECIESGLVSSVGGFVGRFESGLADFVGSPTAVAAVNGTSALHLALVALGVKPGDEVIVPALSFVATASAVALAGAVPHFVDVSDETWGIDPDNLKTYLETKFRSDGGRLVNGDTDRPVTAIVPMHTLGHPCDAAGIREVANQFGLVLVEDAAESLGSYVDDVHTGLAGHAGVFSFNGNKTITTGGGGAIVSTDTDLAHRMRHLSTTAKIPHPFEFNHDAVGYNYRMPGINAALGLAQLEQLPQILEQQRALYLRYREVFDGIGFGTLRQENPGTRSNYWLQAFVLDSGSRLVRDDLIAACLESGISVRPLWKPLNTLSPYAGCPSAETPVANDLYSRVVCLPSSASLAGT